MCGRKKNGSPRASPSEFQEPKNVLLSMERESCRWDCVRDLELVGSPGVLCVITSVPMKGRKKGRREEGREGVREEERREGGGGRGREERRGEGEKEVEREGRLESTGQSEEERKRP